MLDESIRYLSNSKEYEGLAELLYVKHRVDLAIQHNDAGRAIEMFELLLRDQIEEGLVVKYYIRTLI